MNVFSVGDEVLVRILSVQRRSLEDLSIRADTQEYGLKTLTGTICRNAVSRASTLAKVTDVP